LGECSVMKMKMALVQKKIIIIVAFAW